MHRHSRATGLLPIVAASMLAIAQPASAITFEQLSADGSGSGMYYTPTASDWVMAPDAAESALSGSGGNWRIDMGTANFGSPEDGTQTSGIFGAGLVLPSSAYGWRINFSANLRTWDSYNDGSVVAPNPGASLGDWDLFAVNANTHGYYWNLVSTSTGLPTGDGAVGAASIGSGSGLTDPLVPVRPAGSIVSYTNTTNDPAYLPGSTWAWGGRDYAAGYFESVSTNGSVVSASTDPTFVSFVLDSRTPAYNDTNLPSWGQFAAPGEFNEIPGGTNGEAPGYSYQNPILPVGDDDSGSFVFSPITIGDGSPGLDAFLYLDPEVAIGYEFTLSGGQSFKEILLPMLGDADGYTIEVLVNGQWVSIGSVADGQNFTFGDGVTVFRVMGINPSLELNPENSVAFITGVKVNQAGVAQFTMTPITTTSSVPEPSTWALTGMGLALMGLMVRRRG